MEILTTIHNILWMGVPDIVKGLVISIIFVLIFRKAIKKHSFLFYIYPALIFIWYCTYGILTLCNVELYTLMGKSVWWKILWLPHTYALDTVIGLGFIFIVMFIGVLPTKWEIIKQLHTIRKEMSIIGGAILVGHGIMRLVTTKWALTNTGDLNILLMFAYVILGVILLALIFVPWITSFQFARKDIPSKSWKKMQTYTSVPLIMLICVFGIIVNLGWAFSVLPNLYSDLYDVSTTVDGTAVSNLSQGYYVATEFLSARVYLLLMVAYIWLRRRKIKGRAGKAVAAVNV